MEIAGPVSEAFDPACKLGEGAHWDTERQVLWFVDIKQHRLWHYDPASGANSYTTAPDQIGWALPAEGGLLLCGVRDGLYTFDPETQEFSKRVSIPDHPAHNRLNDACCDPWGRVWFGSMDDSETSISGRFYVFDRGSVRAAGPGPIKITNGPAVNRDGTRVYFTDTTEQKILVADLGESGVGEPRLFTDTAKDFPDAYPDGPIIDAEDHLWTGLYFGSRVARYAPDGTLVGTVQLPARDVTKMAFGGPDLKTAYVTTATKNLDEADRPKFPSGGKLLSFRSPVAGFPQPLVKLA